MGKGKFASLRSLDLKPDPDMTWGESDTNEHEFNRGRENSRGERNQRIRVFESHTMARLNHGRESETPMREFEPKCSSRRKLDEFHPKKENTPEARPPSRERERSISRSDV